jgi:hypothetical protein
MLKLIHHEFAWEAITIYQNEKGEYWEVQTDSAGVYLINQILPEEVESHVNWLKSDEYPRNVGHINLDAPKFGENPSIGINPGPGQDMEILPPETVEKIFGGGHE